MRIDLLLCEKGYYPSRSKAAAAIENGCVTVDGKKVVKCSLDVSQTAEIIIEKTEQFVSRAGNKLKAAIEGFNVDVNGKTALDIGASTGGFTDCLLQNGAKLVYALDVGHSQLDSALANDKRVVRMDNTNARYIKKADFPTEIELVVMDVSFISQSLIYNAISDLLLSGGVMISLVKPQFELGRSFIGKGGIVKNASESDISEMFANLKRKAAENNLQVQGSMPSPIKGGDGNTEYLMYAYRK